MGGTTGRSVKPSSPMNGSRLSSLRLMTYNIGGGRKSLGSQPDGIVRVIEQTAPDIVVLQEAESYQDADGVWHGLLYEIARAGAFGKHVHFAPVLSMQGQMDVRQEQFVHALFNDWQDWRLGNALFSRWELTRLGDPSERGTHKNVPLFRAPMYEGDRDTEPRCALLSRIKVPQLNPFVVGVHFTTLVGERNREGESHPHRDRSEAARALRVQQAKRLLALLREHVLARREVVFLLGDLNAPASEPCIASVLIDEGGFERLEPSNAQEATHAEAVEPIDHIFVYPGDRLVEYRCWIVDSPLAREASDHLPVVADVTIAL